MLHLKKLMVFHQDQLISIFSREFSSPIFKVVETNNQPFFLLHWGDHECSPGAHLGGVVGFGEVTTCWWVLWMLIDEINISNNSIYVGMGLTVWSCLAGIGNTFGFWKNATTREPIRTHRISSQAQTQRVADATVEAFTAAVSLWFLVWPYSDHLRDRKALVFGNFWVQMQTMGMITVKGTLEIVHCSISASVARTDHIISCYIFSYLYLILFFDL